MTFHDQGAGLKDRRISGWSQVQILPSQVPHHSHLLSFSHLLNCSFGSLIRSPPRLQDWRGPLPDKKIADIVQRHWPYRQLLPVFLELGWTRCRNHQWIKYPSINFNILFSDLWEFPLQHLGYIPDPEGPLWHLCHCHRFWNAAGTI